MSKENILKEKGSKKEPMKSLKEKRADKVAKRLEKSKVTAV